MDRRRGYGGRNAAVDLCYEKVPPAANDPVKNTRTKFISEMRDLLDEFWMSGKKELVLDPMTKEERKIVHVLARERDLRSHSSGKGSSRFLTVSRAKSHKYATVSITDSFPLSLTEMQQEEIRQYLKEFAIDKDQVFKHYELPKAEHKKHIRSGILHGPPLVPPRTDPNKRFSDFRTTLPAFRLRDQIIDTINSHQVILITGGTGCGKTTQVPQFILEEAKACHTPIRIICTQPRRLPAIAVAERVAIERGETLGTTVGYHIRLEQKCDPRQTILTYCTSGVLLRMLTVDPMATNVTHIILDEIHEREQNTDYLLIALKEALRHRKDLKVILMSATMEGNQDTFLKFFERNHVGLVDVPARLHRVDKFFLADVLAMTGYLSCYQEANMVNAFPQVGNWSEGIQYPSGFGHQLHPSASTPAFSGADPIETIANQIASVTPTGAPVQGAIPPYARQHSVNSLWVNGETKGFEPLRNHWVAASPSNYEEASPSSFGSFPTGFSNTPQPPVCQPQTISATLKQAAAIFGDKKLHTFTADIVRILRQNPLPRSELASIYQMCTGNDSFLECGTGPSVDTDLLIALIDFLMDSPIRGAILVFLPGYDDILSVKERINLGLNCRTVPQLFMLHSQMNSSDQHRVFDHFTNPDERKVILSTNIAEASLTIDDVVFVIDSGKAKEKTYNHETHISQLKVVSIAKSNAEQRSGRAGRCRPGFCFRLYSDEDYANMIQTQVAEMKRAAIHDVCLHAKMFAPPGVSVKAFLGMAPEPPDAEAIDSSFTFLQQIGALFVFNDRSPFDPDVEPPSFTRTNIVEPDLTELGSIIAQLPLDPQLAKLLLFGVALQCFNPVVTLVAALSHRDPFNLPMGEERAAALAARDDLGRRDYSDHLMLIRSYIAFMEGQGRLNACRRYYLNFPTMRMIDGIRKQLMMELRRHNLIPHSVTHFDDPEVNRYSNSWPMVQAAIVAGCYPGIGITRGGSKIKKIRTSLDNSTLLHPSSVVKRQLQLSSRREMQRFVHPNQTDAEITFFAFQELSRIDEGLTLRTVTATTPLHTMLFAGSVRMEKIIVKEFEICSEEFDYDSVEIDADPSLSFEHDYVVEIDKFVAFRAIFRILQMALQMRFKLMNYFMNWLRHPLQEMSDDSLKLLACLNKILTAELEQNQFNVVDDLPKPSTIKRTQNNRPSNTFEQPPTQKTKHLFPTQILARLQSTNSKGSTRSTSRNTHAKAPKFHSANGNATAVISLVAPSINSSFRSDSEERNCATEMLRSFIKHHQTPQSSPTSSTLSSSKNSSSATTISSCITPARESSKNRRGEKGTDGSGQPTWNASYSNDVRNNRPALSTGARFENRGRFLQQNKYNSNIRVQQSEFFPKKSSSIRSDRASESSQSSTAKSRPFSGGRRFYNSSFNHDHHSRKSESQNVPAEESNNFHNVSPPPRGNPPNYQNRQNDRSGFRGGHFGGRHRNKQFPRGGKVAPTDTTPLSNRTSSPTRSNNSSTQQH